MSTERNSPTVRSAALALACLSLAALAPQAAAQGSAAWPTRAVRMIVPYPAGGAADALIRLLGQKLTERWGQQIVVDNRPGANTIIGMEVTARAAPDGYTLLVGTTALAINASLYDKLPFDTRKDFAPVGNLVFSSFVLVVHPSVPARNVKDLVALARARPGQLTFGSGSTGSPTHLSGELLKTLAGVDMTHVPYKGIAPALADLVGGQISALFADPLAAMPYVQGGRLRTLAVSSAKRFPALPDVPTVAESGLPGYESGLWYGLLAPAGTPKDVIARINAESVRALGLPDVREKLGAIGAVVIADTPEQFAAYIEQELARWGKAIRSAALPPLSR